MASAVFRACKLAIVVLLFAAPVSAQPEVDARRIYLGTSGATCTLHAGSGAPSGSLGSVCDLYKQQDSPYIIYVKTGASTWTAVVQMPSSSAAGDLITATSSIVAGRLASVASGQVLASAGVGNPPAYTATPSLTSIGGAANLTLNPTGDLVTSPTGLDVLPGTGYTYNLGALTNKYLTLHAAELWVETLVAQNTLATIGGRILVGPTTTLTSDLGSGATSMSVKHNNLANGDRVLLEANGSVEWMAVTSAASGSGPYTYSITRNLDGSGANNWTAGDAIFNTGTTNSGFIDLYSAAGVISGTGPTIVGNVRTGTTYSQIAPRWAIGNLNGLYGYGATTYGVAFGDSAAANLTVDATNGIRFRNSTTVTMSMTNAELNLQNTGVIKSGSATALDTGDGIWMAANSGTPQMRIGDDTGNRIRWDGTNLTLVSANTTLDSTGITIAPGTAVSPQTAYKWTVPTGDLGMFGYEHPSSAPGRAIVIEAEWTGTGDKQTAVSLSALHQRVSGTLGYGTVSANAYNAGGYVSVSTSEYTRFTGPVNTLQIFTNNGSTTSNPYMRSDGNYLVIEARSTANGGTIYLANDNNTNVNLTAGGGTTSINRASIFTSLLLNGLASCNLAVDGSGYVGCSSDGTLKDDIESWAPGLDVITRLRPVSYRWRSDASGKKSVGFIAQEVEKVLPQAVARQKWGDGTLTLDDRAILAALVNAVKELQRRQR